MGDVEAAITVDARSGAAGFTSAALVPDRDLLALTMRIPEALVLVDLSALEDNGQKESLTTAALTFLPMPPSNDFNDRGADNNAQIGGAGMALAPDGRTLLVTHFNGNGVSVFDLALGAWGTEVAWIQDVGEAPFAIRVSPDGRYAVVANYIGEVDGDTASGVLTVLDIDPTSDRYLEVAAWLVNR